MAKKKWRSESERQAFYLTRNIDRAIRDYSMINEGDRILVGVSGGKDSMALLRLLNYRLRSAPIKYSLFAAHIRGDARGTDVDVPEDFVRWLEDEGVPFEIRKMVIPEDEVLPMDCQRCSWNRRRTLFEIARDVDCNKLALGHNMEDFSQTALLNLFLHGRLETMSAKSDYFGGIFQLIRPLAYTRESLIRRFARTCEFPIVESGCPMVKDTARQTIREILDKASKEFKSANINILRAASRNPSVIGEVLSGNDEF